MVRLKVRNRITNVNMYHNALFGTNYNFVKKISVIARDVKKIKIYFVLD